MMCTKMNIECQARYVKLAGFVPVMNWIGNLKLLECNKIPEQRKQNCIKRIGCINDLRDIFVWSTTNWVYPSIVKFIS